MNQSIYRQGDLLFIQVPLEAARGGQPVQRESGRIVLARGESTGHAHAVAVPHVRFVEVGGDRLLIGSRPFAVTHEEHAPVKLPAGTFRVVRQREYSPAAIRTIAD